MELITRVHEDIESLWCHLGESEAVMNAGSQPLERKL